MLRYEKRSALIAAATIFWFNLLVFDLKATNASSVRSSRNIQEFPSRFSWDIATDNVASFNIIPMLDLERTVKELSETDSGHVKHSSSRRKRALKFGRRINELVSSSDINEAPYSAAVRVSRTCSGTLISNYHVLTAAHCVHNGKRHKYKLPLLKVGIMRRNGKFHWIKVIKMHIPDAWKGKRGPLDADYAVLRLKRGHGQKYLTPKRSEDRLRSTIRFNGFPSDKGGETMWHSSCRVGKVIGSHDQTFLSTCDASEGSSGSGLYASLGRGKYAVTGLVSAAMKVNVKKRGRSVPVIIATKLTTAKVKTICRWAGRKNC